MRYIRHLVAKIPKLSQRGDSGTLYIVFIMAIIIGASFVMVNGLTPEFDDLEAEQQFTQGNQTFDVDPNDLLPPLPVEGSEEYERAKECQEKAKNKAKTFTKTGKDQTIDC